MTPPNELEKLAEFQDAIQSNKGLERLRAMQYLQQMNNQGIMGLPQVQQQPVVRRQEPGSIASGLSNSGPVNTEALTEAAQSGLSGGRKVFNNLDEATAANLPPESKFFIVDDPATYFVDADGFIGKEIQEGTTSGLDWITKEQVDAGEFTPEQALAHNTYIRRISEYPNEEGMRAAQQLQDIENVVGAEQLQAPQRNMADIEHSMNYRMPSTWNVANANGGPVVNRFMGSQIGNVFSKLKENIDSKGSAKSTGTPQTVEMKVPFMGGSGVAYPDPNVSKEEDLENLHNMKGPLGLGMGEGIASMFEQGFRNVPARGTERLADEVSYQEDPMSSPQAMNDEIVNTQGEGITFNFGAANFISNAGGPVPLRENTEQGIRNRATLGGRVNTGNFPRYQYGPGSKITDTWGSNESPQPVNLPIQSQDVTNTFMPPNMVEFIPPFIGGGMIPPGGFKPRMVPADAQGNPIMPFSKQAMSGIAMMRKNPETGNWESYRDPNVAAAQGGYIIDTTGNIPTHPAFHGGPIIPRNYGGIVGNRELQQLQEGGLVDLPVINMGWGGFIKNIFKAPVNLVKGVAKGVKGIVKSKTFKALAPLVLAVAAPYALGALAPSVFGAGATALGGALSTSGALGYGLTTGLGSLVGNLLGGAKFGDAARQGLMSGVTGGIFKGIGSGNWMGTGQAPISVPGKITKLGPGMKNIEVAQTVGTKAPVTGGNPFAAAQQAQVAEQAAQASKIGSNILTTPGGLEAYTGTGLQPTITAEGVPTNIAQNIPTSKFSNIQYVTEGVPSAPEASRTGFWGKGPLDPTGGGGGGKYTGSVWDQTKQIGQDIYKDYGNWKGAAKLVGMDLMQPDWDQVYADEASMEQQLQDMGYTIDTGFGGQRVIRDSSGTVMPSSLSVQDILDRALGRTPRTRLADRIGFEPNTAAQGGLVSLAGGGEFSGMVEGDGHGMEDNVYMPIKERGHGKQIGTLAVSPSEYVVDAHTMSALGNGNPDAGAKVMDTVIESVRKKAYGTVRQPNEINGLNALMPMMQGV